MKPLALLAAAIGPAALVGALGRVADSAWVERLGWTLIHSVWQFAIIALTAGALTWSLRRRSAHARYVANVVLLGAMAVAPGVTFCLVEVSQPVELNQTPIASVRAPEERAPHDANAWQGSPLPESAVNHPPEQGATPPTRREVEPRAPLQTQVSLRAVPPEHPLSSWVAGFRRQLAPRLPLLVSFWLAGMAMFSLRPMWGLRTQWRLRRVGLSPVPASVAQSLNDLARRLGLRRTVAIAQSVRVGVPMAVGYLRPLILLPGCVLTGLTATQLEALLAHELAHIRRHDWLVNAFQLLAETVFFYHPAVWWLSRQIRQERENCCDDLAVALIGDRGTVGRMLLALEELRERTPGLALAATGGDLVSRVRRMVAKGRQSEPAGRERLPAAVLLLIAGLGGAAWAMSDAAAEKKNPPAATPAVAVKSGASKHVRQAAKTPDVRRITGRVIGSNGQPVQAARLWWVVLDSYPYEEQFTIKGLSDAQGQFELEAPAAWKPRQPGRSPADMLWVLAPGKDLKVVFATDGLTVSGKDPGLVISLAPATETEYEIRDEQAHPLVGVVVEPWHFHTPRLNESFPPSIRDSLRRTTDQAGRVRLTALPRDLFYGLEVQTATFGTQHQRLDGEYESSPHRKITLRHAGSIEGRLIADDPQWVRGVKLLVQTVHPSWGVRGEWEPVGESLVETDQQGRFRIPAIAAGTARIRVASSQLKSPVAPRLPTDLIVLGGETSRVEIPMEKLVLVKGSIRTDDSRAPVAGAEILVQYGNWFQADHVISDNQGHYVARVLPERVRTMVISMPREIAEHYTAVGESPETHIAAPAGLKEFELPPIVLAATEARSGTLIDGDGRPIAGARVHGIRGNRPYGFAETNERGEFSLQLPKNLAMTAYEAWIGGRARGITRPTIVKQEPLTLQLGPPAVNNKAARPKRESIATAWVSAGSAERKNPALPTSGVAGKSEAEKGANLAAKTPDMRLISGHVVDSNGQPVKAARLWWVVLDNYPDYRKFTSEGTSDAQGRFALEAPAAWKPPEPGRVPADMLWVLAPGKDLKVVRAPGGLTVDTKNRGFVISLAAATETEYEIRDEQGRPVAGAVAEPFHYRTPRATEYVPTRIRELLRRTTDQSGRVRLTSLSRDALYNLQIQAAGFGAQKQRLDGPEELSPERKITLRRAGRVEGRLIADDRKWARGIKLHFQTEQSPWKTLPFTDPDGTQRQRIIWETEGEILVETDAQGRFEIPEMAPGRGSIMVVDLPASSTVAPQLPAELFVKAGETVRVEIPMAKLVRVKGTIRTDDTQAPVVGAEVFVRYGQWLQAEHVISDGQGHYHARVLPGPVYMQVISMPQEIARHYEEIGEVGVKRVKVGGAVEEFELPPIVLAATEIRAGTLIDQEGQPIGHARVSGIRGNRLYGFAETNGRGEFSLQLPKKLAMDWYRVAIPGRRYNRTKPTIVKYEPFTLQLNLAVNGEKPGKSKHEPAAADTDNRQKTNAKRAVSITPAPLSSAELAASLAETTEAKAGVRGPTLTGKVSDSDGKPVAGATVVIATAGVQHGYSTYCPSCYADCGKRAATDAAGTFAIPHVSPELRFRLLVVRDGYSPVFVENVQAFGGPAAVKLSRRALPDDPHRVVRGHVVGPRGEPLPGAVVETEAIAYQDAQGRDVRMWGAVKWADPLAVTNDGGDFEIASARAASNITLMVRARGMASQRFAAVETGAERHTLALNRGANVRGRLVNHGQPVGGAEMGLVSRDRAVGRFYSEVRVGTEPDGSFLFSNVPVPGEWYVYAKMDSVQSRGATAAVECATERDDETVSVGDVTLQPGHRLRGRVLLTDGKPIPAGMRIQLSTQSAWDDQIHELPADGRFDFVGLPRDDVSISPSVKGYHPSGKNPNLTFGIDGFVDRDVDNLMILLDPGKDRVDTFGKDFRGKPLRSAPEPSTADPSN
jgi:beta-lactamase regulating signal transducer with metallopeptidase domain/protocatechuate 3,4-dioxygenase beta subunit